LLLFGAVCVTSGSFGVAKKIDVNSGYFIVKHIYYIIFAFLIIIFVSMLDEEFIYKISFPLFLLFFTLVCLTFIFGTQIKGSKRWLYFLGFSLQPSEFLKIMFIPLNAMILANLHHFHYLKVYFISFILCIATVLVVILQPDVGMALLIFFSWLMQIFISGIPLMLFLIPFVIFIFTSTFAYFFFEHVQY
jgi:cell division protein FtsW